MAITMPKLSPGQRAAILLIIFGSILVSAHTFQVDGGNDLQKSQEGMITTIVFGSLMLFFGILAALPEGMLKKNIDRVFDFIKGVINSILNVPKKLKF